MPDQPGKGPPSSAPLSVEDADRIADSFTPFWEADGDPAPAAALAPAPVAAARIVVPAARKPIAKQTLLGIAPPTAVRAPVPTLASADATQPMPAFAAQPLPALDPIQASPALGSVPVPDPPTPLAAPVALPAATGEVTQPLLAVTSPQPHPQPAPPPPASVPHNKTLFGFYSPPEATLADPTSAPAPALKSSPDVPGYAIAYTPKDGPSTPAVVIAPEAQSEPENNRQQSLTAPSRGRAEPIEAPLRLQELSIAIDDEFDPYAPKKGKSKLIGALLGGVFAIVLGAYAIRGLSGGTTAPAAGTASEAPAAAPAKDNPSDIQAAAPTSVEPTPRAAPDPLPSAIATSTPPPERAVKPVPSAATPPLAARQPAPVAAKPAAAVRPKAEPVATPRPAARPPAASVPADTNSPPAKPASKGVIVRDAPF